MGLIQRITLLNTYTVVLGMGSYAGKVYINAGGCDERREVGWLAGWGVEECGRGSCRGEKRDMGARGKDQGVGDGCSRGRSSSSSDGGRYQRHREEWWVTRVRSAVAPTQWLREVACVLYARHPLAS